MAIPWLAGCPGNDTVNKDMSHHPDGGPVDGGPVKMQQPGCSIDGWCWMFPQPQGNTLWSTWGSSGSDAWAVGDNGALLHYTGGSWQPVVSPTTNSLWGVWGSSPTDVWAVGDRATVIHYDGQSWTPYNLAADPVGASCTMTSQCLAGQTCDLGKGACAPTPIGSLYSVWGTGADDVWIVGDGGVILHKSGGTLTRLHPPNMPAYSSLLHGVWGNAGSIYAVGAGGTVVKYDGSNWSSSVVTGAGATDILTSIAGTGPDNIFVGSLGGRIWRFNSGAWNQIQICTSLPTPFPPSTCRVFNDFGIYGLWAQGNDVFAVGDLFYYDTTNKDQTKRHGTIKKWDGTQFADLNNVPPVAAFGVWGSDASNMYMVGASGTVMHYDGSNFTSSSPADNLTGVSGPIVGIGGSATSSLTAIGDWGTTLKWSGSAWQSMPSSIYVRFSALGGQGDNLWSVGLDTTNAMNKPYIYQLSGGSWTPVTPPTSSKLLGIWINGTDGVVTAENDVLLRRNGASWVQATVVGANGTALRAAWGADATHVWVVGGGDYLNMNQTTYPGKILLFNGVSATPVSGLPTMTTLNGVFGTDSNHAWAVGDSGTILVWDGSTWKQQQSGTPFPLYGVWASSPTDIYAVGGGGTVLHSDGTTWKRQDAGTAATLLAVFGLGKDVYATGFSGAVLHLTNQ